jgi:hypothetical protein
MLNTQKHYNVPITNNLIDDSHYYHSKVEISSRSSPKNIYDIVIQSK